MHIYNVSAGLILEEVEQTGPIHFSINSWKIREILTPGRPNLLTLLGLLILPALFSQVRLHATAPAGSKAMLQ